MNQPCRGSLFRLFLVFFLGQPRQRDHSFALFHIDKTHTLCVAADDSNVSHAQPNNLTIIGDKHQLIVVGYLLSSDDATGFLRGLHRDDALAAARLETILLHFRALALPVFRHGQNTCATTEHFHADAGIAWIKPHSHHAVGSASGGPNLIFLEANRLAIQGRENKLLLSIGKPHTDYLVAIFEADSPYSGGPRIGIQHQIGFFDRALLGRENNKTAVDKLANRKKRRN